MWWKRWKNFWELDAVGHDDPGWDGRDRRFMIRAVQLARRGLFTTDPNPRVGCVLAREGVIVGEGWHERAGGPHAERVALAQAGESAPMKPAPMKPAQGATAYVTLEPCCHVGRTPPCTDALIEAGIGRVVGAMADPNPRVSGQGFAALARAGIRVETGLMAAEAESLNPGFLMRMRHGRPFVRCKLAMSLDGRTAMSSGESQWITEPAARRDVQRLRARSSAIVTGVGTVLADNPSMTARLEEPEELNPGKAPIPAPGPIRQPLRVVLDPGLATPPDAKILQSAPASPGESLPTMPPAPGAVLMAPVLMASPDGYSESRAEALRRTGARVVALPGTGDTLDLHGVMEQLAHWEINEVLLECGARLAGAMLRENLIDELILYLAPTIMGSDARGLFELPELRRMTDRFHLEITDIRAVGRDWRIEARRPEDRFER